MSAFVEIADELIGVVAMSRSDGRDIAACVVRDGVITGEGPTTRGRIHFSRALDASRRHLVRAYPDRNNCGR
jgi:hypothetical protein